jgi:hypothetical protein
LAIEEIAADITHTGALVIVFHRRLHHRLGISSSNIKEVIFFSVALKDILLVMQIEVIMDRGYLLIESASLSHPDQTPSSSSSRRRKVLTPAA